MIEVTKSIEIAAPVQEVYNQWTQFEEFPRIMKEVEEVRQIDEKRLYWRATIAGVEREWHSEIIEQVPDHWIAWRNLRGAGNAGAVLFEAIPGGTRVTLQLRYDWDQEWVTESIGNRQALVSRVEADLRRFKEFIEQRGRATGAWRGEIHGQRVLIT